MTHIVLIEDDAAIQETLSAYLKTEGFAVTSLNLLGQAKKIDFSKIDLLVLDWMLPDGQGIDFLRDFRKTSALPVILLTARAELVDKIVGLETGANDYLTKPFEPRELVARIRVQLRIPHSQNANKLQSSNIVMDLTSRQITFMNKEVPLTKMEFDLLRLFLENPNKVFSRDELLNKVWGFDNYPTTRTVDTHILQLRNKFADELFETVRGVGYRYNEKL